MRPVFIGGCSRSGTTVLGAMLGTHTDCLTVPESQFIIGLLRETEEGESFDAARVAEMLMRHFRFKTWEVDIPPLSPQERAEIDTYPRLIERFVRAYGRAVGRPEPRLWIEHSPINVQHGPLLLELFPDARMLHVVRDGRAVAASVMKLEWGPNEMHTAAQRWMQRLAYGFAAELVLGAERVQRVRYEELIAEPEATLRRLCDFLDLDYQPEMIRGSGLRVPEFTAKWHSLVGAGPDRRRLDAWQQELDDRQIEIFESLAGDLLRYLGYAPRFGLRARPMTAAEKVVSFLRDRVFRRPLNHVQRALGNRRVEKAWESRSAKTAKGAAGESSGLPS